MNMSSTLRLERNFMRVACVIVILASLDVTCVPAADSFRAKLAAGCTTTEECDTLHERAQQRYLTCMKEHVSLGQCNEQLQDRMNASQMQKNMQNKQTEVDDRARRDQLSRRAKKIGRRCGQVSK